MAYFGELNKWIGTSPARLQSLTSTSTTTSTSSSSSSNGVSGGDTSSDSSILVELSGSLGEELLVGFLSPSEQDANVFTLNAVMCNVTETGRVFVSNAGCVADA
jgi:hypothetical protein